LDHYTLQCLGCDKQYPDSFDGFYLQCAESHKPAFLRARYSSKQLEIRDYNPGIFRYSDWLPIRRIHRFADKSIVFRSEALASRIGLENLFIAFNGYWPEKGAHFETCSFKELEALAVTARIPDSEKRTLVVSSAGNTGMAFLQVCSRLGIPLLVIVPAPALSLMWTTVEKHPNVTLAALDGGADYLDCIKLADAIAEREEYYQEGGAKNVARRDGMGTVVLAAVEAMGVIPDHYVQAIGSGTGGIAAWEASNRLLADGRFGSQIMHLHLVQNAPFSIIADAWNQGSPELLPVDEKIARKRISEVYSKILSNRQPPYSINGGVFDALRATEGYAYSVTNKEAREAGRLFNELEGCDIHPAAAVALAGLCQAVSTGKIGKKDSVLLNITGGGTEKLECEGKKIKLQPDIAFSRSDASLETIFSRLRDLHKVKSK
jgi:cysteate synthase